MEITRKLALFAIMPFALIIVGVIRLLAAYGFYVRFGELFTSRIGHLAGNLECYLCEKDAGLHPPSFDLWVPQKSEPSNRFLAKMVSRSVHTLPASLLRLVSLTNCMFDGWQKHIIGTVQFDRDIHNLWEKYPTHFKFTASELKTGAKKLRQWGVDGKWVCLIVRDSTYLPHLGYHSYRDSDIQTYEKAALALANSGYYVFRMGAKVARPMSIRHPRIIDYAVNGMRSDFMDVYLGAHCTFCVTNGTGFDAIPAVFRRPLCFVNYAPFEYLPTWFNGLAIWKHYQKDGKRMSVEEIAKSDAGHFMTAQDFENANISLVDNTPEEIKDVCLEMAALVNGKFTPDPQERFWERFPKSLSKYNQLPLHGEVRLRVGSKFLCQYDDQMRLPELYRAYEDDFSQWDRGFHQT